MDKIKIKNFIEYAQDSIVSKIILKNKCGNITLFALDQNQNISEHISPFDAFLYVLEGKIVVTVDKRDCHLTEHEALILPKNIPHAVKAISQSKMMVVMIKNE